MLKREPITMPPGGQALITQLQHIKTLLTAKRIRDEMQRDPSKTISHEELMARLIAADKAVENESPGAVA